MRKEYICKECGGSGENPCKQHSYRINTRGDIVCGICGHIMVNGAYVNPCPSCNGTGHILLEKHIEALIAYEKESDNENN